MANQMDATACILHDLLDMINRQTNIVGIQSMKMIETSTQRVTRIRYKQSGFPCSIFAY